MRDWMQRRRVFQEYVTTREKKEELKRQ